MNQTKLKLFFWSFLGSAIFSLIPFILIVKMASRPLSQGLTVYSIITACTFLVFYGVSMIIYSHRAKLEKESRSSNS